MTPEIEHYLQFFQDQHKQIAALIEDLPPIALNWKPLAGPDDHATNSIAILVTHITGAEQFWIGELLGQRAVHRDRDSEFQTVVADGAALRQRLDETDRLVAEVLRTVDPVRLDEPIQLRDHTLTIRWGVVHMIEHTAQHLGHMQLTRQLWQHQQPAT